MTEKDKDEEKIGGVTQGVLHGLGRIIPGFEEIIKGLEKSTAFQERLKVANEEIEKRLKKAPTRGRNNVIPPENTLKVNQNAERELLIDIFDEGSYLRIIAEMPGVDEKEIKIEIKDNLLILSTPSARYKYYREIELPCLVKKEFNLVYKNGILEIKLEKR